MLGALRSRFQFLSLTALATPHLFHVLSGRHPPPPPPKNIANQGFRAEGSEPRFPRTSPRTPGHSSATLTSSLTSLRFPSATLDIVWFPALPPSETVLSGLLRSATSPEVQPPARKPWGPGPLAWTYWGGKEQPSLLVLGAAPRSVCPLSSQEQV